jgi:hypothetical protein
LFQVPWHGLDVDIGVRVTGYQCALAGCLIAAGIRLLLGVQSMNFRFGGFWLLVYVVWTVGVALAQIPLLREAPVEGGAFRAPIARALLQVPVFLLAMSPVILLPMALKLPSDIYRAAKVYLFSCVILAVIGWFQLLAWYSTGTNPLQIGFVNELLGGMGQVYEGIASIGDDLVFRMNSFGGEPKYLGVSLVIAVLLLQQQLYNWGDGKLALIAVWAFLLAASYATFSTSAIYLWAISTTLQALLMLGTTGRHLAPRAGPFALTVLMTVGLLTFSVIAYELITEGNQLGLLETLHARTLGRGEYAFLLEDYDEAILALLWENPILGIAGVGLGNIHLLANEYLAPVVAEYGRDTAFSAKAGYLRLVTESGFIGLALYLLAFLENAYRVARNRAWQVSKSTQVLTVSVAYMTVVMGIGYLATSLIAAQLLFALGLCVVARRILDAHAVKASRQHGSDGSGMPDVFAPDSPLTSPGRR